MNDRTVYDELDQAIDGMSAECSTSLTSAVADLIEVAADLRSMPREDFKRQLRVELEWECAGRRLAGQPSGLRHAHARGIGFIPTLLGTGNSLYPFRGRSIAASLALHVCMVLLMGAGLILVKSTARIATQTSNDAIDVFVPKDCACAPHGGGSGGAAEMSSASKGEAPRFARDQLTPAAVVPRESKIKAEATLIGPPDLNLLKSTQTGDPLSTLFPLSNGPGVGGIGSGRGDGDGMGNGPGRGPGAGGGFGDGFYLPGNGVTAPRAIYKPEPDYSDEARQVKHQGIVTLSAVIAPDGRPTRLAVVHSLGMGLDQKALETVRTWRFEPGKKDGHPVAVQITVEVDFRIF